MQTQNQTELNPSDFTFDWRTLDPEHFRGPGLSFPLRATLVVTPDFNELVISATETFHDLELVAPEDVNIYVLQPWDLGPNAPEPFNTMTGEDIGLRLHYICGSTQEYLLSLSLVEDRHYECCEICGV